ncbi:MAG: hypothetical protein HRU00_07735 [Myxococcales bacterium]|nr:hypothetical protein [Myxococcales bacterium]
MHRQLSLGLALVLTSTGFAGCAPSSMSADSYSRSEARQVHRVQHATVLVVRPVSIEGTRSGLGGIAGGALGYVVGSAIGGGRGTSIARVAGGIGGAAGGAAAEEALTRQQGLELTVELENGELLVVVQAADETFDPGDSVRVIRRANGTARVIQ